MPSPFFILLKRLRYPLILLIVIYSTLILGFTLIPGRDDQGNIWYMSFFHAFYFVSFMGSTIGFGEIPYPFTNAQRLWTIFGIFSSVIAWIYSIGNLLSIIKEPVFQRVIIESSFLRSIKKIKEPYFVICGYGDTGHMLAHGLSDLNIRTVVIDKSSIRIETLAIDEPDFEIPGLCANAVYPESLTMAGIENSYCMGVIALTNDDQVNLKISITSKLLNKKLIVISRANTRDIMANMASFDTNHIINPFEVFARHLALAIRSPSAYLLYDWFTSSNHFLLEEPPNPPKGHWIVCGYGRFGKEVNRYLKYEGIRTSIIEANPEKTNAPKGTILGSGTEAITLKQAGITKAAGIIAGTDNDSNNLSIIMTANEINKNKNTFSVARQNFHRNSVVYGVAALDLVMQPSHIIAHEIMAIIKTPLLYQFLSYVRRQNKGWVNVLTSRITGVIGDDVPSTWAISLSDIHSETIRNHIQKNGLEINDLIKNPRDRTEKLHCIPLLLKMNHKKKNKPVLLPKLHDKLTIHDTILFCGDAASKELMHWTINNINTFQYVITGETYNQGYIYQSIKKWLKNFDY